LPVDESCGNRFRLGFVWVSFALALALALALAGDCGDPPTLVT